MIPLEHAQALILDAVSPLEPRAFATRDARGLVLAQHVVAVEPVPPFANTGMDGYAVRAADTPGRLRVLGDLPAGHAPTTPVGPGEAIRIMTGAPMPDGADAVVMVERTRPDGDWVVVEAAKVAEHVRAAGGDVEAGAVVFEPGTMLTPAHLGVLSSLDVHEVRCHPRPRVWVISTGDELIDTPGALQPGRIRDSNRPMLLALLAEAGCDPVDGGIVGDDEAAITEAVMHAADTSDVLLTSGAVSVGDYDFVKVVLERVAKDRGGTYAWSQVAIKPAKPLAFAMLGAVPAFGLPGNPVSSRVSFELFARPALRKLAGRPDVLPEPVMATALSPMPRTPDGKLYLDRVRVQVRGGRYVCERQGLQGSNVLSGMAAANGLALIADGDGVNAGAEVPVILL
ncbi:MAG TPA: gephyrin-like molybdotransferase Glp [Acidimicrobiia bacterium]|nr:gephyrin-like molybdotransferase Glp [Acidimicrobiia bacterium]